MSTTRAEPLHPNLAVIARDYDLLIEAFGSGRLAASEASTRIGALIARDDTGVQWRISPTSGAWERQMLSGDWVHGAPPSYGIPTPTARDLSDLPQDPAIHRFTIPEALVTAPGQLAGTTRLAATTVGEDDQAPPWGAWAALAAAMLVLVLVIL